MADELLIRAYNVELGDCIYCRIPGARSDGGDFHMLIDCGTWGPVSALKAAMAHLKSELPSAGAEKRQLDLLVVTHEHKDHIAGFDADLFEDLEIGAIWMSTAMDRNHKQSTRAFALQDFARRAMRGLAETNISLTPELQDLVDLYSVTNDEAIETLQKTLPKANDIDAKYVSAGDTAESLGLTLTGVTIDVIGPEKDIDGFYLGEDPDLSLRALEHAAKGLERSVEVAAKAIPTNISLADFRRLQSRMMSGALAFADEAGAVINNTSVVLLIEWKGKRLLFVGDAEWDTRFREGKKNASWNVMWAKRKDKLAKPIDFLKVGHHGSINATPWNDAEDGKETEPSMILDSILPTSRSHLAQAIVSTLRKKYQPIPSAALLSELGRRVSNAKIYQAAFKEAGLKTKDVPFYADREKSWIGEGQPVRTDFEALVSGEVFVEVRIKAEN
ncbi:MBL fold metallo-hydrolase [Bradyrhizobium oligotrophicum]|uniref:MBL fold metallo-hydrolase n=2 Tax=Bradyrhizobium oligotrophicum TaxID=44255 RepID=UPI003EB6A218